MNYDLLAEMFQKVDTASLNEKRKETDLTVMRI